MLLRIGWRFGLDATCPKVKEKLSKHFLYLYVIHFHSMLFYIFLHVAKPFTVVL